MIFITGSNGFIGKNLVEKLDQKFIKYKILKRHKSNKFKNIKTDYYNFPKVFASNKNILIHLSSPALVNLHRKKTNSFNKIIESFEKEIENSISLINFCKKNKFKKIIYISSSSVYGDRKFKKSFKETDKPNPISYYAKIKLAVEALIKKKFKNTVVLRLFHVYGKNDDPRRLIPTLLNSKKNNKVKLQDCLQVVDPIHVDDVCKIILNFYNSNINSGLFNVGNSSPVKLRDIVNIIKKIKKGNLNFNYKHSKNKKIINYCYANTNKLKLVMKWKKTNFLKNKNEIY